MSITTPTVAYLSNDGTLTTAEKNDMITDLGGALQTALDVVDGRVDTVDDKADAAQDDANSANVNANTRCLDSAAIKTTGNQTKAGILTLSSFATYTSIPANPSGNQIPRYSDIENAIQVAIPNPDWNSITLLNGWTGTAKYRIVSGYFEIWFSLSGSSATSSTFGSIATTSHRLDHNMLFSTAYPIGSYLSVNIGTCSIFGYTTATTTGTFKMPRLAP